MQSSIQHKSCLDAIEWSFGKFWLYKGKHNNPNNWYKVKNFVDIYSMALEYCNKKYDSKLEDPFFVNPSRLKACYHGAKYTLDSVVSLSKNLGLHGEGRLECGKITCEVK